MTLGVMIAAIAICIVIGATILVVPFMFAAVVSGYREAAASKRNNEISQKRENFMKKEMSN